jgi:hypothetical protein
MTALHASAAHHSLLPAESRTPKKRRGVWRSGFLPDRFAADRHRLRRFEQEALAAAALNHPNIVTIYAVDRFDDVTVLCMEFVDGRTLANTIVHDGFLLDEFLKLAIPKDSPNDDKQPAFSPDGESIAFRSERQGGGIFVMGRTGESAKRVTDRGYNP